MMDEFTIKCASRATRLRLHGIEGDYFHAELTNLEFHGVTRVWQISDQQFDLAAIF